VIEALAGLVLLGVAGALVAAAAATSLRVTHQATVQQRLVAVAAREMSSLQLGDALPEVSEHPISEPGLSGATVSCAVSRPGGNLADLSVSVTAGRPQARVLLQTRALVSE